jgi:hypothetical protein
MLPDFRVRQRDYLLEIARAISQELNLDILIEAYPGYFSRDAGRPGRSNCTACRGRGLDRGFFSRHPSSLPALSGPLVGGCPGPPRPGPF